MPREEVTARLPPPICVLSCQHLWWEQTSQRWEGVFLTLPGVCCLFRLLEIPRSSVSHCQPFLPGGLHSLSHSLLRMLMCGCGCVCVSVCVCARTCAAHTGADANCRVLSLVSSSLLAVLQPLGPLPESAAALPGIPPALPDTNNQVGFRDPLQRPLCCLLCQVPFKKMTAMHFLQ